MALLKCFAPLKTCNMHVHIRKPIACLWVWLHLPVLPSKRKTWKCLKWPICENYHPQNFHKYCGCLCGRCTRDASFLRFNYIMCPTKCGVQELWLNWDRLSKQTKSPVGTHSSCDVTDYFIKSVRSTCYDIICAKGYRALPLLILHCWIGKSFGTRLSTVMLH